MKYFPVLFLIGILFSSGIVINIDGANAEISRDYVDDRLLVKFNDNIPSHYKQGLLNQNDAVVSSEISQIGVLIIDVPPQSLDTVQSALENNPAVKYVEKDWILEPAIVPNDSSYSSQWHLGTIGAEQAWDVTKGDSSPIAILDTGIDITHQDLSAKLQNGWNFYNNNSDLTDTCGHGTKVAGAAAAITNNDLGVAGVAWNNPIIPIKITDTSCLGYYSAMLQGITHAADNGAKVANISFQVFNGDALTSAAQYMHSNGGWVVVAAGNTGSFENYLDNPYVISVGATSSSDVVTSFSSYGPFVDFTAPGSGIYTTRTNDSYGSSSGTSFASPITAGAIALVFASDPTLTPDDVYNKLKNSALDLGDSGRDDKYGWGRINVAAALADSTPIPDTIPPTVTITNPADGSDVSGIITVSVDANDDTQVDKVELLLDGVFYQEDVSDPYSFTIDTDTLSSDTHTIEAISYDSSNNSANDQISVIVSHPIPDTIPPTVTITNPADGSDVSGLFSVDVVAFDDVQVQYVELYLNGVLLQQDTSFPYSFSVDSNLLNSGGNIVETIAYDNSDNFASDQITINLSVDDVSPIVSILNPTSDQIISGKTLISILAFDDSGINKVEIFVDGILKATSDSSFDYMWNPKGISSGIHTITSIATDNVGNSAQTSVDVIIEKGGDKPGNGGGKPQGKK
jgi:subtilisin family serine protease